MAPSSNPPPTAHRLRLFDALRIKDYRFLWFASWLWNHARWIEAVSLGWIVLERTDSPWLVGLLGFFRLVPLPFLGLLAGVVADRANRKRVILFTQAANLTVVTLLYLLIVSEVVQVWHIALVTLVMGINWTMDYPSRRVMVLDMVGSSRLANALSLEQAAMTGGKMLGPFYGGLLLAYTGAAGAMFSLMVLYVAGLLLLLMVQPPQRAVSAPREPPLRIIREGLAYVLTSPLLLAVISITVTFNIFFVPFIPMVPVFARDVLGAGPVLMGILAAADGAGSFVGSLFLASRGEIRSPGRVFAYGATTALAFILGFALSKVYALSVVFLFLAGLSAAGFGAMQSTMVLLGTPEPMRGRAMGALTIAIGTAPLGILVSSAVAEAWGAPIAVSINCVVALFIMGVILLKVPIIRRSPTFPTQEGKVSLESIAPIPGTPSGT